MKVDEHFLVCVIPEGEEYEVGRGWRLCGDTLVEFYDTRWPEFGPKGQFVSRYYLHTLLESEGGLILDTGSPDWRISAAGMDQVRAYLRTIE